MRKLFLSHLLASLALAASFLQLTPKRLLLLLGQLAIDGGNQLIDNRVGMLRPVSARTLGISHSVGRMNGDLILIDGYPFLLDLNLGIVVVVIPVPDRLPLMTCRA